MKTLLFCMVLCICLLACGKKNNPEALENKQVIFRIYTSSTNPPPVGDTTLVTIRLKAFVSSDNGNTGTRIWDTTLQRRLLRLYPNSSQPLVIIKNFDRIAISKEWVHFESTVDKEGGVHPSRSYAPGHILSTDPSFTVYIEL